MTATMHTQTQLDHTPPQLSQLVAGGTHRALSDLVGHTPVLWIPDITGASVSGFWAKLEGQNPGGVKDRTGLYMVAEARRRGELAPDAPIVESTSGTLGLGLALAGMVYDHPVTVVADVGMEPLMRHLLAAYGVRVDLVTEPHPTGGWQEARRERVQELLTDTPGAFCPNQYHNPDNVAAYEPLGDELAAQLGRVDVLVCSIGTGGHSAGTARVLRRLYPELHLVGVDSIGSTIFGQPARTRLMRGLGSSIYPRNVAYDLVDEVHWVAPGEAVWAARRLAAARYATGGWSVGAIALVASWLSRTLPASPRIAAIFPDGPHRYASTVFNDDYCTSHDLADVVPSQEPDELGHPEEREVTTWTRCTTVIDPLAGSGVERAAGSWQVTRR